MTENKIIELYGGRVILKFNDASHRYTVAIDGKPAKPTVGVTSISGQLDKPALLGWAVKMAVEYMAANFPVDKPIDAVEKSEILADAKMAHRKTVRRAATMGSMAHEWAEHHIKAILGVDGFKQLPMPTNDKVLNCVKQFLDFEQEHVDEWHSSERLLYSIENDFAGTMDCDVTLDGIRTLGDFKTSSGIYPEALLQTGGYWGAAVEEWLWGKVVNHSEKHSIENMMLAFEDEIPWKQRAVIRFGRDDAKFEFKIFKENERDFAAFADLRRVLTWSKGHELVKTKKSW